MKTFILLVACLFGSSNALSCYEGGFYTAGATDTFPWASASCASAEVVCVRYETVVTDTESGASATTSQGVIGKCATVCPTTCGTTADLEEALKNGMTDATITSVAVDSATCKIQCCTSDNCNKYGSTATVCPAATSGASSIESGMLFVLFAAIGQMILA